MSFDQPQDDKGLQEVIDERNEERDRMADDDGGRINVTDEYVETRLYWMRDNIDKLSQAIANRQHLEQFIKVVEAQEKAKHVGEAANRQETLARSSDAYIAALDGYREASAEEQKLRYRYQFCDAVIQVWRTKEASNRKGGL